MLKIIIFFIIGTFIFLLTRKIILLFTNNPMYQYILSVTTIVFFTISLFFRENKLNETEGIYIPPKYDGETVIPVRC